MQDTGGFEVYDALLQCRTVVRPVASIVGKMPNVYGFDLLDLFFLFFTPCDLEFACKIDFEQHTSLVVLVRTCSADQPPTSSQGVCHRLCVFVGRGGGHPSPVREDVTNCVCLTGRDLLMPHWPLDRI
jgi:hypothetical protein